MSLSQFHHCSLFFDLASSLSWSAVTPIPAIIEPTTQLCAITRNLMRYLLVVMAGPLFLYAIAPQTIAATVPATPVQIKIMKTMNQIDCNNL